MSRTTPETGRLTEPAPPTNVACTPGPTPIHAAAPRSSTAAFAPGVGQAPPATARLPTRGGVSGSGLMATGSSLPPARTTPFCTMYIGVSSFTSDIWAVAAYKAGADDAWVPTQRSGPFSCCLVAAYEAGMLEAISSPAPTTPTVSVATATCTAASHHRSRRPAAANVR